jgi:YihY family inner membrane protein
MNRHTTFFTKLGHNLGIIYKNFTVDQGFLRACTLAYITFLGFIPFLMVVLLFTPDITVIKIHEVIIDFIFEAFVPKAAETMRPFFDQLLQKRVGISLMGFGLLIITSFLLFKAISGTFDKILGVDRKQNGSLLRDIERFFAAIIGGLILVAAMLFAISLPVINKVFDITFIINIVPYIGIFILLFLLYKYITYGHPKTKYVLTGAVFTSLAWVILKLGFDWYIGTFTNIRSIYGTVGAFPVFMIWLYANWVLILFGMEIVAFGSGKQSVKLEVPEPSQTTLKITMEHHPGKGKGLKQVITNKKDINVEHFLDTLKELLTSGDSEEPEDSSKTEQDKKEEKENG